MSESEVIHGVCVGRFCGPERSDGRSRRKVNLMAGESADGGIIPRRPTELEPMQAAEVARALMRFAYDEPQVIAGQAAKAAALLKRIVDIEPTMTPPMAVALAEMLCHIAGGDGRGVYEVYHWPEGDRL